MLTQWTGPAATLKQRTLMEFIKTLNHGFSRPPVIIAVTVSLGPSAGARAVKYCGYIQGSVSGPGTCSHQPCVYTAAPFRSRNTESTHYSEVGPTEGWGEGWMGGALVWHPSQLRIGRCPGNGTSDLIYPLAPPTAYVCAALARAHLSRPCSSLSPCAGPAALLS